MGRADRSKDVKNDDPNEGTSARTRPFSFKEIMSRRKKKLASVNVGKSDEKKKSAGKAEVASNPSYSEDSKKGASVKVGGKHSERMRDYFDIRDESDERDDPLVTTTKGKSSYRKSVADNDSRYEMMTYHSGRGDREGNDVKKRFEKNRFEGSIARNKYEDEERTPMREGKRKHYGHIDSKYGSDFDDFMLKRHDPGRSRILEYPDRYYRKQVYSRGYEDYEMRRKRSRSRDYYKERDDRSVSPSPRSRKYSYHQGDYGDSSAYKDKKRGIHSDVDKFRNAGNGEDGSGYYHKRGSGLGGYSPRRRTGDVKSPYDSTYSPERSSGLGGYSPRKRTEAAKAPYPTTDSPEKRSSTWDIPPSGNNNADLGSVHATPKSSVKARQMDDSNTVTSDAARPQNLTTLDIPLLNESIDSIQLTQATRPMRRLYIENLPPSMTEKTLTDCLDDFLLSSGVNHIQGTKPCISCIINKEKCQALVEFLTPQDATAALSFDGSTLCGAVLKIRRPKDFVETAAPEKTESAADVISDIVEDTPYKVFVGGISKFLSRDLLLEIVSAFGPLKAYKFEFNEELNGHCAFLEYVDHDVTFKACAGLNGMKLGGAILTAVQANPSACGEEDAGDSPTYAIPLHAKPLLADSTQVLQLENMYTQEEFALFSEDDLQETLEDIRLECARFGTVKSLNVVRYGSDATVDFVIDPSIEFTEMESTREQNPSTDDPSENLSLPPNIATEQLQDNGGNVEGGGDDDDGVNEAIEGLRDEASAGSIQGEDISGGEDDSAMNEDVLQHDHPPSGGLIDGVGTVDGEERGAADGLDSKDADDQRADDDNSSVFERPRSEVEIFAAKVADSETPCGAVADAHEGGDGLPVGFAAIESDGLASEAGGGSAPEPYSVPGLFEPGSVLVEFVWAEAACMAAHCLHGRLYGERAVAARYVPRDLYLARFPR